jgi:hypothetical protein
MQTYKVYQQENTLWAFRIFVNGKCEVCRAGFRDYTSAQFAAQQFRL